jgi:phenylalanyl-tRNA synthetase beta chain
MPTVAVDRDELFERLGRTYTQEEFEDLCFQFGVELDDVLTEAEASAARGLTESTTGGAITGAGRTLYYIAMPANRTDLLCIEGVARALNVFLGKTPAPVSQA